MIYRYERSEPNVPWEDTGLDRQGMQYVLDPEHPDSVLARKLVDDMEQDGSHIFMPGPIYFRARPQEAAHD